jgi:hypothetical protein
MQSRHDDLRDELLAILGASRELPAEADRQLAEAFIRFVDRPPEPTGGESGAVEPCHESHYTLQIAGGIWGAALTFLTMALVIGHPTFDQFIVPAVLVLVLAAVLSRGVRYLGRNDWHAPVLQISIGRRRYP